MKVVLMDRAFAELGRWTEALRALIVARPDEVVVAVSGLVAAASVLLLIIVRRSERAGNELTEVSRENAALRGEIATLRAQQEHERTSPTLQLPTADQRRESEQSLKEIEPPRETPLPVGPPREESAITRGLRKSRAGLMERLASFFSGKSALDSSMLDELEEILILSDVGARCASELVESVKEVAQKEASVSPERLKELLKEGIRARLVAVSEDHRIYKPVGAPMVVLVVGVNGVGKTTTVAKLAAQYIELGKRVMVIAADTFRAAAVQQLEEWSRRVNFTLVKGPEGAKPGAVVFDGMASAKDGGFDVVLIDTAGRLHTKSNLMQELEGVRNSIRKHSPDAPHETLLVVDGVSGQNALAQAREFNAAVQLTGIVVTKLDGTPKGGIIVAISQELKLPVLYVGVGEKVGDLVHFKAHEFVCGLLEGSQPGCESGAPIQTAINQ